MADGHPIIRPLRPGEPAIEICARWRHAAFLEAEGFTLEQAVRQLAGLVDRQGYEVALVAEVGGAPAGTCLFIRREIEQRHDVTPWLAGLFVASSFRGRSVGSALVVAIEDHARTVGCDRIYLYATDAAAFYARLGWGVLESFDWDGEDFVLMSRGLGAA